MKSLLLATVTLALLASAASASGFDAQALAACHNVTGTCLAHGFVCANEEVVAHGKRCDGVEDCSDGTDEFMCGNELRTPMHELDHEARHANEQATCVNCNCKATTLIITSTMSWFPFARVAPVDFLGLATGVGASYGGRPCNPVCVTSIQMTFYRKNGVCRGWLCCARQNQCMACTTGTGSCPGTISPIYTKRCYIA